MKHGKAILAGLLAGLAAPSTIASTPRYLELQGSDLQRIRSDSVRVGNTFKHVIARESSKKAKSND